MDLRKIGAWAAWAGALVFLGWFLPRWMGVVFVDRFLWLAAAALAALFASPGVCDRVAASPARWTDRRWMLGRIAAGAGFGLLSFAVWMTIDALRIRSSGAPVWPDPAALARATILAAAFAWAGAAVSAWAATRARSGDAARRAVRTGFLVLLAAAVFAARHLPDTWRWQFAAALAPGESWAPLLAAATLLAALGAIAVRAASPPPGV